MLEVPRTKPARRLLPIAGVIAGLIALSVAVRFVFIGDVSTDYRAFVSPWYDYLKTNGGFAAVGGEIGNYNPPYLYLLAAVSYLPVSKIVAIKMISIVFDVVLAGFGALIVKQCFPRPVVWLGCFAALLFAPTVMLNSASWGQCDSIYAAFTVGSLYFLLRSQPWWACVFFGLALSFKLQAVFFLPVLLIVLVVNRQRLLALLAVPATVAAMLLPAALAGRDLSSLLMIYPNQITGGGTAGGVAGQFAGQFGGTGGGSRGAAGDVQQGGFQQSGGALGGPGGGAGQGSSSSLTQNAPTFYQWVTSTSSVWKYLGLAAAGLVTMFIAGVALVRAFLRRRVLSVPEMVVLATTVVLAVPFLLPEMHERYFYLADVLTIVTAFYVRRYWVVAAVVSACSLLSYAPFLWQRTLVPLQLVAFAEFLAVIATVIVFVDVLAGDSRWLRPSAAVRPAAPRQPEVAAVQ